jgi:hypothetical protein
MIRCDGSVKKTKKKEIKIEIKIRRQEEDYLLRDFSTKLLAVIHEILEGA